MVELLPDIIAGIFGPIKKGDLKQTLSKPDNIYWDIMKLSSLLRGETNPVSQSIQDKLLIIFEFIDGVLFL
jgi:hypothetical protein